MQTTRGGPPPFHPGERAVQARLGVREQIELVARQVIRPFMPEQHRTFYASLPFLVAAARDQRGRPWATLLTGVPGFVASPDDRTLVLHTEPLPGDALAGCLAPGSDLGLLGIEFATRRRNRVNGRVVAHHAGVRRVAVAQSFGNCPQYIRPRAWTPAPVSEPVVIRAERLTPAWRRWLAGADTFFIASGYRDGEAPYYGMDAAHRGGAPGFVQVLDERTVVWPDYAGNQHFNTLGNLVRDPRVGLLFVDFEQGHLLQLTGRASIDWGGAQRQVTVEIEALVELRDALPLRWQTAGAAIRSLTVTEKRRESAAVTSFRLHARDGGALPDFIPGQYLPIELAITGQRERVSRTYSLSAAPNGQSYRLTVKREPHGRVSRYLHDALQVGDVLSAGAPAGEFTLRPGTRPVVLVSAGVGVTPMMSMLGALSQPDEEREVWFIHGVRHGDAQPLAEEGRQIAARTRRLHRYIVYSQPRPQDVRGRDYDRQGRIDAELIATLPPSLAADFYLCGPPGFVATLRSDLLARGVAEQCIYSETFTSAA